MKRTDDDKYKFYNCDSPEYKKSLKEAQEIAGNRDLAEMIMENINSLRGEDEGEVWRIIGDIFLVQSAHIMVLYDKLSKLRKSMVKEIIQKRDDQ